MNDSVTDDDFSNSDSWLSENFFNQLKDFNNEFKERFANEFVLNESLQHFPSADTGSEFPVEIQPFDLAAPRLDPYDATFGRILPTDLNFRPVETASLSFETVGNFTIDCAPVKPPTAKETLQLLPTVAAGQPFVCGNTFEQQQIISPFITTEEELKFLKFLEDQPSSSISGVAISSDGLESVIKCANCNGLFDAATFQAHFCNRVSEENLPAPPPPDVPSTTVEEKPFEPERLLPLEPACMRLLKENQIRIRRFLKDELKYDINALGNSTTRKNSSLNDTVESVSSPNTEGLDTSLAPNASSGSSGVKKQEGPHECTLCERKFVHASGLVRHMEKHALDLIPTTNPSSGGSKSALPPTNSFHSINGLRVVIKCTLCGRIFFEQNSAFVHLCSHFPNSIKDEQEMDNCADIPYESYLDDALDYLKNEVNGSSCDNNLKPTNCFQEYKAPLYLKMVILSCILQCEFCDFVFSDVSYLFVHSSCHIPQRRFECFSCGIHVRTSKEICTHWQAECVFMRENLKIHQAITQRYFVCNVCENKFQSLDLLHEHRYTSYHFFPRLNKRFGILQLPCEYCDFVFDNAHDCVVHYEDKHYRKYKRGEKEGGGSSTSSKTRQYLCDICGKSYTQSSHLWQHLRFHQGVKPFACKEPGCTRKFTIRPDLNDHIRKCHTGERPYHCLICGKRFLTGSVFYQHRLIHRGERRYECEDCGKRFYRADALKNHQRIHTGEKPFGCLFCTKNFRQRGDRDKHIRARHSHLDANARLMMQMQKLQLEAAAAATQEVQQPTEASIAMHPSDSSLASSTYMPLLSINNENIAPPLPFIGGGQPTLFEDSIGFNNSNNNDIIMIGNVAFPKTMIETLMLDIDEESVLRAMQLNSMNLP